jgi:hypothetical protein
MAVIQMSFIKCHNIVTSVGDALMRRLVEPVILHFLFTGIMANPSNLQVMAESSRICCTCASAINSSSYYACKESNHRLCVFPSF